MSEAPPVDLDAWLPRPGDPHPPPAARRAAGTDELWRAAAGVRLDETRTIGRLVQWRIPGTPGDQTFRELCSRYPFRVLDGGDRWLLSGMCGRIWSLARDYPVLADAEAFRGWDARGTVRVLFAHWAEPAGPGRSALVSEARVEPVDRRAELALRGAVARRRAVRAPDRLRAAVARDPARGAGGVVTARLSRA